MAQNAFDQFDAAPAKNAFDQFDGNVFNQFDAPTQTATGPAPQEPAAGEQISLAPDSNAPQSDAPINLNESLSRVGGTLPVLEYNVAEHQTPKENRSAVNKIQLDLQQFRKGTELANDAEFVNKHFDSLLGLAGDNPQSRAKVEQARNLALDDLNREADSKGIPFRVLNEQSKPMFEQVTPEDMQSMSPDSPKIVRDVQGALSNVTGGFLEMFKDPMVLAGLGIAKAGPQAAKAISTVFALQMAASVPEQANAIYEAWKKGDRQAVLQGLGNLGITSVLAPQLAKHGGVIEQTPMDMISKVLPNTSEVMGTLKEVFQPPRPAPKKAASYARGEKPVGYQAPFSDQPVPPKTPEEQPFVPLTMSPPHASIGDERRLKLTSDMAAGREINAADVRPGEESFLEPAGYVKEGNVWVNRSPLGLSMEQIGQLRNAAPVTASVVESIQPKETNAGTSTPESLLNANDGTVAGAESQAIAEASVAGGPESAQAPEVRAVSRANNSIKAFADANGVPYVEGDTGASILEKVNAKKISSSPEVAPETAGAVTEAALVNSQEPIGMGAAVVKEFNNPGDFVSNMFAKIDADRAAMGKEPMPETKTRTWDEDNQRALTKMNREPDWIPSLLADVKANPRPLLSWENAGVVWHRASLRAEYNNALKRIAQNYDDGQLGELERAKADAQIYENAIQSLDETVGRGGAGSEAGRSLRAQAMATDQSEFSLIEMRLRKREAVGGRQLTDSESKEVAKLHADYAAKQAELQKHLAERDNKIAELQVKLALDKVEADTKDLTYPRAVIEQAQKIVDGFKKETNSEKDSDWLGSFFKKPEKRQGMGAATPSEFGGEAPPPLPPEAVTRISRYGGTKIAEGYHDRAKWEAEIIKDLGEGVRPYLEEAWNSSNKWLTEKLAQIDKQLGMRGKQVTNAVKKTDLNARKDATTESIKEKIAAGKRGEITGQVQKLARLLVESGIKDREALIDAVHAELQKADPTITRRETMDAISGYGDFKQLTKDEISVQLRDLKGQMQQLGKLEDMASGKAPLKTGVERRSPSDVERQLIQQVNEAKKKGGFEITDPEKQLASALQARKTYYENRMADLKAEIASGERNIKTKTTPPTDAALEALKSEYTKLKEEHQKIFGDRKLTDEQRLKMAIAGVERQIAEFDRRIKEGDFSKKSSVVFGETPELKAAKARRDALRDQFNELRDLDAGFVESKRTREIESQKAALEKSIAEKERQLAEKDFESKGQPVNRPADPMLEPLKQRSQELSKKIAEARKKPADQVYADRMAKQLEMINKRISDREAKIAAKDISASPKKVNRPLPKELEEAKQKLEALNKELAELRKPKVDPVVRAINQAKRRMTDKIAELNERMAAGDYAKRKRPTLDISGDRDAMMIKGELEKTRSEFEKNLMLDRAARRNIFQKSLSTIKEIANLPRAIWTAYDLSGVGRQGGIIGFSRPSLVGKNFKPMIEALKSDKVAFAIEQSIQHRPNAPLYARSKLYLSDLHEFRMSRQEEIMMSKYSSAIPGVRMSNRAFITYLNLLRADAFDALVESRKRWFEPEITQKEYDGIANYINIATGRGNVGKAAGVAQGLATVFFSPRLVYSRFQYLAGQPFYRAGSNQMRVILAAEYARTLGGIGALMALGLMAGATIEGDPRSSDFLKMRFGDTRVDPMMGLSQNTVLLSRLALGQKTTATGKVNDLTGNVRYGAQDIPKTITDFLRSKLAPVPGALLDLRQGKNVVGTPINAVDYVPHIDDQGKPVLGTVLTPLSFQDIKGIMEEHGIAAGTALEILNLFGMSVQHYETQQKMPK